MAALNEKGRKHQVTKHAEIWKCQVVATVLAPGIYMASMAFLFFVCKFSTPKLSGLQGQRIAIGVVLVLQTFRQQRFMAPVLH